MPHSTRWTIVVQLQTSHHDNVLVPPAVDSSTYRASGPVHLLSLWLPARWRGARCQTTRERSQSTRTTAAEDDFVCIVLMHTPHWWVFFNDYALYIHVAINTVRTVTSQSMALGTAQRPWLPHELPIGQLCILFVRGR